jgi:DNA-directed RNA polymerase II subunit RPB1
MITDIMKYLPEKNNNWKLFIIIFKTLLSPKRILMEYRFTKSAYDYLLDLMKQKMIEALINPGELVGIIAAQTLGQNTTQLTLNSFHTAGSATGSAVITEGLPRLLEIINITKNLKNSNMWIYLKDEYSTTKEEAQKIRAKFTYTKLKNLLTKSEILFDNKNGITDANEDREFIRSYKDFTEYFGIDVNEENSFSPWILRLIFDKETMMNRKITVQEVQEIIKENSHNDQDIECIFSDDSSSNIVMRIRIKHDGKGNFLDFMKDFEKQLIELTIRGIDKIESLELKEKNIIKYSLDGSLMNTKEWVLNTNGSNLIDIMSNEAVDTRRTTTNNILEFFEIFGIEATRSLLYVEIKKIFIESNPNPRHIQMFADLMTYRGKLMTIDRHGVNKNPEIGPIGKASFEEVMNIFTKSALFAEKDNMKGVSANILAGQFCPAGTNNFELMIDEEKIIQSINNEYEEEIIMDTDVDRIFQQTYGIKEDFEDIDEEDFEFGFGLENNKKHLLNEALETDVTIINTKSKDVEKIVIDEKNLEEVPIEPINYSQNVDFDAIELEDPTYKEQNKEKKIKIVRKKK